MSIARLGYVLEPPKLRQKGVGMQPMPPDPEPILPMWTIDGVPLMDLIVALDREQHGGRLTFGTGVEMILPFYEQFRGHWDAAIAQAQHETHLMLLGEQPSDLPSGRYCILVCPLCGDVGCGAFSATIERRDDVFVWSGFFDEPCVTSFSEPTPMPGLGPFEFAGDNYVSVLAELCGNHAG